MKKPYNSKARVILDIAIQVAFYAFILGTFWLFWNLMP
jgi:hypothetical protein